VESITLLPGVEHPRMEPVFGQCTVISSPLSVMTSAKNRLYRLTRVAFCKGFVKIIVQKK